MARYKVLEVSFINSRIHQPGELVDLTFKDDGVAGPNLQAVDADGNPLEAAASVPTLPVRVARRGAAKNAGQQTGDTPPTAPAAGTQSEGVSPVCHTDLV